jgi:hypothetical protein
MLCNKTCVQGESRRVGIGTTLQTCIREILGSNLGRFIGFSNFLYTNYLQLDQDRILSNPYKFTIHPYRPFIIYAMETAVPKTQCLITEI